MQYKIKNPHLLKAIEVMGTKKALTDALGIKPTAIYSWHGKAPAARAVQIEEITKGVVTREMLRPDLFKR